MLRGKSKLGCCCRTGHMPRATDGGRACPVATTTYCVPSTTNQMFSTSHKLRATGQHAATHHLLRTMQQRRPQTHTPHFLLSPAKAGGGCRDPGACRGLDPGTAPVKAGVRAVRQSEVWLPLNDKLRPTSQHSPRTPHNPPRTAHAQNPGRRAGGGSPGEALRPAGWAVPGRRPRARGSGCGRWAARRSPTRGRYLQACRRSRG